ncbi:MAG: hypothetical protein VYE22_11895 [Myxococcota bacterium]|nr:hypothetical protein [Myxococcota bacterium]
MQTMSSQSNVSPSQEPRALRILAKSVFRELKSTGHSRSDIVAFATEMLSLVSSDIRGDETLSEPPPPAE